MAMHVSAISFGVFPERAVLPVARTEPRWGTPQTSLPDRSELKVTPGGPMDSNDSRPGDTLRSDASVVSTGPVLMLPLQESKRVSLALGEALVRLIGGLSTLV